MQRALLILVVLFTVSCNRCNTASDKRSSETAADSVGVANDTTQLKDLPWITAINPKTGETHLQHLPGKSSVTPQQIVRAANKKYPQILLQWIKQEGNTVYLAIPQASYLTQSMGSAGAEAYLSEITYSLTEIKGVTAVDLRFEEGDHASPGVYTREQFKELISE